MNVDKHVKITNIINRNQLFNCELVLFSFDHFISVSTWNCVEQEMPIFRLYSSEEKEIPSPQLKDLPSKKSWWTSNFGTNSYGESWDSSCEKSCVPGHNQWVPVQKTGSPKLKILGPLQCM